MSQSFVDIQNVTAMYRASKQAILKNVSFSLNAGDHVVVFGAPASGKSSLLKLLCGDLSIKDGDGVINGVPLHDAISIRSGYVGLVNNETSKKTVYDELVSFGESHDVEHLPAVIGELLEVLELKALANRSIVELSTIEHALYRLARASLSKSPLLLLDDVIDTIGVEETKRFLDVMCNGRTVLLTTRMPVHAEEMQLPIMLMHAGTIAHAGTQEAIGNAVGVPRVIDAWVEGLRYDMLKKLRAHNGVLEVRILPTDRFEGNLVRIMIRNSRFMPSLYDVISQSEIVHIEEAPTALKDILKLL